MAAAWIVGAFYYQLAWPLGSKALVLAAAGALLALLAGWIRTGKMGMPLAWWESICGHPVLLGDGKMFEAVQREIFEVKP